MLSVMIKRNDYPVNAEQEASMQISIPDSKLALAREGLLALRDARGARLTAHSGAFWVTQEGSGKDHVIDAGQSLTVCADGLTVVTALQAGEITVHAPAPAPMRAGLLRRVQQFWRQLRPSASARAAAVAPLSLLHDPDPCT